MLERKHKDTCKLGIGLLELLIFIIYITRLIVSHYFIFVGKMKLLDIKLQNSFIAHLYQTIELNPSHDC
jgi:hypothetical protein